MEEKQKEKIKELVCASLAPSARTHAYACPKQNKYRKTRTFNFVSQLLPSTIHRIPKQNLILGPASTRPERAQRKQIHPRIECSSASLIFDFFSCSVGFD
jgi:hypothetical protein